MCQRTNFFDKSLFATPGVVMSPLSGGCISPAKIQEDMLEVVQGGRKNCSKFCSEGNEEK
jgi:hypothetical protein